MVIFKVECCRRKVTNADRLSLYLRNSLQSIFIFGLKCSYVDTLLLSREIISISTRSLSTISCGVGYRDLAGNSIYGIFSTELFSKTEYDVKNYVDRRGC